MSHDELEPGLRTTGSTLWGNESPRLENAPGFLPRVRGTSDHDASDALDYAGDVDVYGPNADELVPGAVVHEGDLIGYDDGRLHIVSSDVEPRDGKHEEFLEYQAVALDLDIAGYLDLGSFSENDNAMSGRRLAELAEELLGHDVDYVVESDNRDYGTVRPSGEIESYIESPACVGATGNSIRPAT